MIMRCLKRHVVREVHRAITTDLGLQHHLERAATNRRLTSKEASAPWR